MTNMSFFKQDCAEKKNKQKQKMAKKLVRFLPSKQVLEKDTESIQSAKTVKKGKKNATVFFKDSLPLFELN